jgi:hypothetical protein
LRSFSKSPYKEEQWTQESVSNITIPFFALSDVEGRS